MLRVAAVDAADVALGLLVEHDAEVRLGAERRRVALQLGRPLRRLDPLVVADVLERHGLKVGHCLRDDGLTVAAADWRVPAITNMLP